MKKTRLFTVIQGNFEAFLNSKCPLDSYESGTFKCDPALSDTKEEIKDGNNGKSGKSKSGRTDGSRHGSTSGSGRGRGKRGGSSTGGTDASDKGDNGERSVRIEGLGVVRVESNATAKRKGLEQIEVLRDNQADLQKISTIKDAKTWLESHGYKEPAPDAPAKVRSPANRITTLMKDPEFTNLVIFDRARIAAQVERGQRKRDYAGKFAITHKKTANMKMTDELVNDEGSFRIVGGDTVQGCDQMCYECYANKMTNTPGIRHQNAVKAVVTSTLFPNEIMRVGTNGEPGKSWKHTALQIKAVIKRSNARIEKEIAKGKRVDDGKRITPEGNIFFISKMLNIDDWDASIIKNVEVSMDPLYPDHMRQTMSNVMRIKTQYPDTNFVLRIRSIASKDPAMMAVQEDAVEFANALGLPVLETKLRFNKGISEQLLNLDMSQYSRHIIPEPVLDKEGNPKLDKNGNLRYRKENQLKLNAPLLKGKAENIRVCNEKNVGTGACAACQACYDLNIRASTRKENIERSKVAMQKLGINLAEIKAPTNLDVRGGEPGGVRSPYTKRSPKPIQLKKKIRGR